jgi:hypothetical protein
MGDAYANKTMGRAAQLGFEFVPMSDEIVSAMTVAAVKILEDYGKVNARGAKMVDIIKTQMKEMGYLQ